MFPWEHVAFGYLCYSMLAHAAGRSPRGVDVVAVVVATIGPDAVDKTLSWVLGLFPQGYSVAHSVFVATLVSAAVLWVAARNDRLWVGVAFVVAYYSHLVGDVVYPVVWGDALGFDKVLWPLVTLPPYGNRDLSAFERFMLYMDRYAEQVVALDPDPLLTFELVFMGTAFAVWLYDGAPALAELWDWTRRRHAPATK